MTTDTKAVARFFWSEDGMDEDRSGKYVLFTDHERVVGELERLTYNVETENEFLRHALAASRAEVEENEKVINVWRGRAQRAEAEAKGLSQSLTDSLECEEDYLLEISELRAEVEGLKKDAERYRWIRQNVVRDGNNGVQFDSEIDAAMKEQAE